MQNPNSDSYFKVKIKYNRRCHPVVGHVKTGDNNYTLFMNIPNSLITRIYHNICMCFIYFTGLLCSGLLKVFDVRLVAMSGALISACFCFVSSFSVNIIMLGVTFAGFGKQNVNNFALIYHRRY